jgi:plasmid stabilization system protein ParE
MDFKVLIADSAIADLKEIVEFVAADNPEAAIRLGEKLLSHALSLAAFAHRVGNAREIAFFPERFVRAQRSIHKRDVIFSLLWWISDDSNVAPS